MANVVRLVNGGAIQVRTGALQGIGPPGPMGRSGPPGPTGPQGPIGETGPFGAILQASATSRVGANNPVGANTDTTISFGSVGNDTLGAWGTSTSNILLASVGDYLVTVWLRFDAAAAGTRDVWFKDQNEMIARKTLYASTSGDAYYLDLAHTYHSSVVDSVVNVVVRSSAATAISQGTVTVTRMGSGPQGVQGPQGLVGPPGPTGAQGIQGVPGVAGGGFTHYSDLKA